MIVYNFGVLRLEDGKQFDYFFFNPQTAIEKMIKYDEDDTFQLTQGLRPCTISDPEMIKEQTPKLRSIK
jgi:hypothetical protein